MFFTEKTSDQTKSAQPLCDKQKNKHPQKARESAHFKLALGYMAMFDDHCHDVTSARFVSRDSFKMFLVTAPPAFTQSNPNKN